MPGVAPQEPVQFEPVHPWHPDIRNNHLNFFGLNDLVRLSAIGGRIDQMTLKGEDFAQQAPVVLIVISDQKCHLFPLRYGNTTLENTEIDVPIQCQSMVRERVHENPRISVGIATHVYFEESDEMAQGKQRGYFWTTDRCGQLCNSHPRMMKTALASNSCLRSPQR